MNKKKKKNPAADNLIESLMNDLNNSSGDDPADESHSNSLFSIKSEEVPKGFMPEQDQDNRVENGATVVAQMWDDLKDVPENSQPDGLPPLPDLSHEEFGEALGLPSVEEDKYQGPSLEGGYQSSEDFFVSAGDDHNPYTHDDQTRPSSAAEDRTVSVQEMSASSSHADDNDKTLAVEGYASAKQASRAEEPADKIVFAPARSPQNRASGNVFTSMDASLIQSENLKIAQNRILSIEKELEKLRGENEELASAAEIVRNRVDEYAIRITSLEKEKSEMEDAHQNELLILKGNLQYKESEMAKARLKVEELETRLKADLRKIRVKERELENRLDLVKAEKAAVVRSKDEYILDMKRKIDQLQSELDNYRGKVLELNKTLESNQEQVRRTVRALRLALSNLEEKEENLVPLKKAK